MFTIATPGGGVAVRAVTDRAERASLPRRPWSKTLLACIALVACDTSSTAPQPGGALEPAVLASAEVEIISGDDQQGVVGSALGGPLVVMVVDSNGDPLPDAPVTWTFGSGKGAEHGNASRATVVTQISNVDGMASVDWELGTTSGPQLAWAEVGTTSTITTDDIGLALAPREGRGGGGGRGKKVRFQATSGPSVPAQLVVSQTSLTLEVGETVMLTAVVLDQYGNEIPDAVVEWRSSDPSIVSVETPTAAPSTSFAARPNRFGKPPTSLDSEE